VKEDIKLLKFYIIKEKGICKFLSRTFEYLLDFRCVALLYG